MNDAKYIELDARQVTISVFRDCSTEATKESILL